MEILNEKLLNRQEAFEKFKEKILKIRKDYSEDLKLKKDLEERFTLEFGFTTRQILAAKYLESTEQIRLKTQSLEVFKIWNKVFYFKEDTLFLDKIFKKEGYKISYLKQKLSLTESQIYYYAYTWKLPKPKRGYFSKKETDLAIESFLLERKIKEEIRESLYWLLFNLRQAEIFSLREVALLSGSSAKEKNLARTAYQFFELWSFSFETAEKIIKNLFQKRLEILETLNWKKKIFFAEQSEEIERLYIQISKIS